ncbi:hypothetical protein CC2G_013127 [Coprinopsis cinerea AmutBmut pab1-1]|nr:hypothetical protein CC2G_013127 [Coprinopsis cinerea AmutBmut pab1-1]
MMSRITINLKKSVHKVNDTEVRPEMPSMFTQKTRLEVSGDVHIVAPGFNQPGRSRSKPHCHTDTIQSSWEGDVEDEEGHTGSFPMIRIQNPNSRLSTIDESLRSTSAYYRKGRLDSSVGGVVEIQTYESFKEDPYPARKGSGEDVSGRRQSK